MVKNGVEPIQHQLKEMAERACEEAGFELVEVAVKGGRGNRLVQFFIDREDGLPIEDCAQMTRSFSECIEHQSILDGFYRIEVSSPGLDRPLVTARDFRKNIGKDVDMNYLIENQPRQLIGTVADVEDGKILLKTGEGIVFVPLQSVVKAKIKLKW